MSIRKITGDALNRILVSVKQYIDGKDLGFEDIEISGDIDIDGDLSGDIVIGGSSCKCGDLYKEDVVDLLNKNLSGLPDDTK